MEECKQLHDEARWKYLQERDYEGARRLFERIVQVAVENDDAYWEFHCRGHVAECHLAQDRYDLAVDALRPALDGSRPTGTAPEVQGEVLACLYTLASILMDLPAPLTQIENVIRRVAAMRDAEARYGGTTPRLWHRYREAQLLMRRGMFERARAVYLRVLPETIETDREGVLLELAEISIELGASHDAARYLEERDAQDWRAPGSIVPLETVWAYRLKSRLARLKGMPNEAVRMMERSEAAREGDQRNQGNGGVEFVRAHLAAGDLNAARTGLVALLPALGSPRLRTRFAVALVAGDYRLSCARQGAGMEPRDFELGPGAGVDGRGARRTVGAQVALLARARRWYLRARRWGEALDERLECSYFSEVVSRRMAHRAHLE